MSTDIKVAWTPKVAVCTTLDIVRMLWPALELYNLALVVILPLVLLVLALQVGRGGNLAPLRQNLPLFA